MAWFTRRRIGALLTGLATWYKPLSHLYQIPGYIDDGLSWSNIFKRVGSMMTITDGILLACGVLAFAFGFFPERWLQAVKKPFVRKSSKDDPNFDMPFEKALAHIFSYGTPYISYEMKTRPVAEREIARRLHEIACQGEIHIAGMRRGSIRLEKITPEQLIELTPSDAAIPKSPEAPGGYHWIFVPKNPPTDKEYTTYWGLRFDSRDIYKFWSLDENASEDQKTLTKEQIHHVKAMERGLKADINRAYQYVSQALDPRILNPEHPGNPHAIKHLAQDATDALIPQLKAQGIKSPLKLNSKSNESLKTWHDFLRELRINYAASVNSR